MAIAGSVEPGMELCSWGHVQSPGSPLGVSCLCAAALVLPSYLCWLLSLLLLGGLLASAPHGPEKTHLAQLITHLHYLD